ncbi:hypothetical protein OEZ86_013798 [Tetradesmus obliquus]|uniref:Rhodanese domain-containing protein n=2 Tax=Tetradesmus obliquus TaxID=3088 RepID=A0ABY8UHL1_TETOB|nr:hypothetical protein OEZ85_006003 [Tetradesmus obliquus]WIA40441.1 hypothetical protein OEZ86_013798 [Tetradesmus obliquus]
MALQQRTAIARRAAFSGRVAPCRPAAASRRGSVKVQSLLREWSPSNKEFIELVLSEFPDKGVATVEEARALYSNGGYTYLDVRSQLEVEEVGKVKDAVNIPFMLVSRKYDPETRERKMVKEPNPDFVRQVEKRFPNKDAAKLLIACADGRQYSIDVLEALDEAGYSNLVGLRGGYYAWFKTFDNKLARRRFGEYAENYSHDGDSGGIHASGAGFEKMDPAEAWRPPVY